MSMRGSSLNRRCIPLTLENKAFAEDYQHTAAEIDEWASMDFLNFSGIREYISGLFESACRKTGGEARKDAIARAQKFIAEARVKIDQLRSLSVEGISLLKQRSAASPKAAQEEHP
jgi:hypothetical protein